MQTVIQERIKGKIHSTAVPHKNILLLTFGAVSTSAACNSGTVRIVYVAPASRVLRGSS